MQPRKSSEVSNPPSEAVQGSGIWWWVALVVLLVANLPLMICMPLTADPITYDLQAQTALDGGVLYRDIVEPNLPGVVWVHMAVRSLLGWSTYALRSFDLVVFTVIVVLLVRLAQGGNSAKDFRVRAPILALLLCWFYFSMTEWAHCQRDTWLMLPALCALCLRVRQLRRFQEDEANGRAVFLWGGVEGLVWGMAFWIKPFITVPALGAFLVSACLMRSRRGLILDFGGVLFGGAFCGVVGSLWLFQTGAWPHFWDMALNWNPEYFEMGRERWTSQRYISLLRRFLPWTLVHFAAIPIAVRTLLNLRRSAKGETTAPELGLLSALYLGWLIQAHTLQHLFDYVHVPAILLGLGLLAASWPRRGAEIAVAKAAFASVVILALITSPATRPARLAWWGRCLTEGSSPEVRCGLQHVPLPNWKELEPVVEFLKSQNVGDGKVTAYNVFLIHLYPELGVKPSTRYVFPDVHTRIFRNRTALIEKALNDSPQQFVVSSLLENGMLLQDVSPYPSDQPPTLPARFPAGEARYFPYNQKLVFRSGQYVVHQVTGPVGPLNTQFFPLDPTTNSAARENPRVSQLTK